MNRAHCCLTVGRTKQAERVSVCWFCIVCRPRDKYMIGVCRRVCSCGVRIG